MPVDPRAQLGAENNADLYVAMFEAQQLAYARLPFAFVGMDRPPPFYANLTVVRPDHTDDLLAQVRACALRRDGAVVVKDSFCELALQDAGFRELFTAKWIWREAAVPSVPVGWRRVDTHDIAAWETAWKAAGSPSDHRMFPPAFVRQPDVYVFGRDGRDGFAAGCIVNVSDGCVGLSNVFSNVGHVFGEAAQLAGAVAPGLPLVGYESGADLEVAQNVGFEAVGDLRILRAVNAQF